MIHFQLAVLIQYGRAVLLLSSRILSLQRQSLYFHTHPEKGVQSAVFHKFSDDHDGTALCDHTLQSDDVGMVKLTHDGRFRQEVPPLFLHVARLQGLDGYVNFPLTRQFQAALVHFSELTWGGERTRVSQSGCSVRSKRWSIFHNKTAIRQMLSGVDYF